MRGIAYVVALVLTCTLRASAQSAPAPIAELARPLTNRTFERTPARLARGRYLTEGVLQCFICHSDRDWNAPGAPPAPGLKGAGHVWQAEGKPWLVAPNLTPDARTGIGRWTDDMLARAIREGVSHDGRPLAAQMYSNAFHFLTDEDLASVIVYLRSLPPIRRELPATVLPEGMAESLRVRVRRLRAAPPEKTTADSPAARGQYLVRIADCQGCHTAWEAPANPGQFGGGNHVERGGRAAFGANLTPSPSGIPYYTDALFVEAIRTGSVRARALDPIMPWIVFRRMSDADLRDVFAFLRTLRPIDHNVSNIDAPAFCAACRQTHGLGGHNHAKRIDRIAVDPASYDELAGEYVFDDNGVHAVVRRDGSRLLLTRQGREIELLPVAPLEFDAESGLQAPLRFERGPAGRIVAFTILTAEPRYAPRRP
jgi:mono/diheme cytochrome c family protein